MKPERPFFISGRANFLIHGIALPSPGSAYAEIPRCLTKILSLNR
jgi:hypothetical protein